MTETDPPHRLLLAWHLGPEWGFDPDPAKATEVEFTYGETGVKMREAVSAPGGWSDLLQMYAKAV